MQINDKYLHVSKRDITFLKKVLATKQLSGTSETISEFETQLSVYFKSPHVVALSSGSAALHAALHCLQLKPGDEVLIPAIAPLPSALPLLTGGYTPIFVDNAVDSFSFDPQDLEEKISSKTKAAVLVPLWGYPLDYRASLEILKKHNIPLIEDCAQAHGSTLHGEHYGTFGEIGCWSTHDRKILATGEGGFIATANKELAETVRQFSQLGYMDNVHYGVNYKLSSVQAALGMARLPDIEDQIEVRVKNVKFISESFSDSPIQAFPVVPNSRPNYYGFVIKLPFGFEKNKKFIMELDERGIPSDILKYKYKPLYQREVFSRYGNGQCLQTEETINSITSIPVHPGLSQLELEYMAEQLISLIKKY